MFIFAITPGEVYHLDDVKPAPIRDRKIHTKLITKPPNIAAHEIPEITDHVIKITRLAPMPVIKPA